VNLSTSPRSTPRPSLGACLALLFSGCIPAPPGYGEPPAAATAGGTTAAVAAPAAPTAERKPPREFKYATSADLLKEKKLGWNLGNSLDVPDGETAWGNPTVSPALLTAAAEAGFNLVRIPVTWSKHMGAAPDYVIDPSWLTRVDEVVSYAHAAGLYAIINVHHDGADGFKEVEWITLNDADGKTTDENNAAVRARFVTVWTQIARHFAGYGEELLFESMNEIHDGYGNPDPRHFGIINDLNQEFVKLVRASGGNNQKRHLVVPGYNTNIDHTLKGFKLPDDPTPNRLILSVHYYDPYLFALQAKTNTWGSASPGNKDNWGQEDFVVKQFDKVKATYVDQGIPVIIGEYGATHQEGFEDYRRYYMEYVTKAAVDRGIVPIYWDNGSKNSGGESFGLFDRGSNTVLHPHVMDAMKRAATSSYKLSEVALPKPK
jgi:endoglucanase